MTEKKRLYRKEQYYPLGDFCVREECLYRLNIDEAFGEEDTDKLQDILKKCEKECVGVHYHEWMRGAPDAP